MSAAKEWIQCYSGGQMWPLNPAPNHVRIADIAAALSKICRYTGQIRRHYSVAEHCVRVSYRAEALARLAGKPPHAVRAIALWGLLHDASEAYIADVSRPVKRQGAFEAYRLIEKRMQAAICVRFGLSTSEPAEVREADYEMLGSEAPRLFPGGLHPEWAAAMEDGWMPPPLRLRDIGGGFWLGWSAWRARRRFLKRFRQLGGRRDP